MRFILLTSALTLAFASAAHGAILREPEGTERLELVNGAGVASVVSREGTILGSVGRGRIVIFDMERGAETSVRVTGCETRRRRGEATTVCIGRALRFSVVKGAWRVTMIGQNIDAAAVVEGAATIEGTRGQFSIAGGERRRWPRDAETFELDD
jgi:hypothetical protein